VPPDPPAQWVVKDFEWALDVWAATENPPDDLLILIATWGLGLLDEPQRNARPAEGLGGDIWFAIIPGTWDGTHMVTLTFFLDAVKREVRCSFFGYQTPPFGR
jgi:hypothetical protein